MNRDQFWTIIDSARKSVDSWEDMLAPLVDELSRLDVRDIFLWQQIFTLYQQLSYKNKLWAAAYVINGGCSDDGFDYFRGWLTAQGKDVFLQALADPDSLADVDSCEEDVDFEDILSAAALAYFQKLGIERDYERFYQELDQHPLSEQEKKTITDNVIYAADIDADWDEDDDNAMKVLLPKLCTAFEW